MAPSYTNLFMGHMDQKPPYRPFVWWRYIDDIFIIWTHGTDKLQTFIDFINKQHPTIQFTADDKNHHKIPFLDVTVSLQDGKISTDLYVKPTDTHQYLLSSSCHPKHTKTSISYILPLGLTRICSTNDSFEQRKTELTKYLTDRGYKHKFITT